MFKEFKMDIKLKNDEYEFKLRVAGCLIKDDHIFTVQICNNGFFCFPGGHLHLGEDSKSAIIREFKEEANLDCKVEKLFAVIENFFRAKNNKIVHEICFFYLLSCENTSLNNFSIVENDDNILKNLEFRWYNLKELYNVDFKPSILKDKLINKDFSFSHFINDQTKE